MYMFLLINNIVNFLLGETDAIRVEACEGIQTKESPDATGAR